MVNYLYDLEQVESNHEQFVANQKIAATSEVKKLAAEVNKPNDVKKLFGIRVFLWGRFAPQTPRPPSAAGRIFGLCHNATRPILSKPMIAWGQFYDGASPHTPTRPFFMARFDFSRLE